MCLLKISRASWPRGCFAKPWRKDEFGEREKKGPVPALRHVLLRCRLLDTRRKERTHYGLCEVLNVGLCVYHSSCAWLEEADPGVFVSRVSARVCNASPHPFWPGPSQPGCPSLLPVALPVLRMCMSMPSRLREPQSPAACLRLTRPARAGSLQVARSSWEPGQETGQLTD